MLRCYKHRRNTFRSNYNHVFNNSIKRNLATKVRDENMSEFEQIVDLCSRRGFVFQSSEIYGGLAATFDYGPLGVEMKNNIKKLWWRDFIHKRKDCVGIDTPIIMHPEIWKAAGHVDNFVDPIVRCEICNKHIRADKLIQQSEQHQEYHNKNLSLDKMQQIFQDQPPSCDCGAKNPSTKYSDVQTLNMLFETYYGPTQSPTSKVYLRPETAQGIFVNFRHVVDRMRKKLPLGIGQIGKAFRNEIAPRDFLFRTREFEQMELEYFCHPNESDSAFDTWVNTCYDWVCNYGLKPENLRIQRFDSDNVAHYAAAAADIEYKYPFGWQEMWGIANRTDYDLSNHSKKAHKRLEYRDPVTNEKYIPYCIEPSVGLDRLFLAFIIDAYSLETVKQEKSGKVEQRAILKLHPSIAPYRCAIMPLVKKENITNKSSQIFETLLDAGISVDYDDSGSIGKRYRRQDEIGTPASLTVDYQTIDDDTVTIRDRDTMKQDRIPIKQLKEYLL